MQGLRAKLEAAVTKGDVDELRQLLKTAESVGMSPFDLVLTKARFHLLQTDSATRVQEKSKNVSRNEPASSEPSLPPPLSVATTAAREGKASVGMSPTYRGSAVIRDMADAPATTMLLGTALFSLQASKVEGVAPKPSAKARSALLRSAAPMPALGQNRGWVWGSDSHPWQPSSSTHHDGTAANARYPASRSTTPPGESSRIFLGIGSESDQDPQQGRMILQEQAQRRSLIAKAKDELVVLIQRMIGDIARHRELTRDAVMCSLLQYESERRTAIRRAFDYGVAQIDVIRREADARRIIEMQQHYYHGALLEHASRALGKRVREWQRTLSLVELENAAHLINLMATRGWGPSEVPLLHRRPVPHR